ncbi:cupin domain-containing protein [Paenibacillus sp.]|uniref:cupin domain-containing protein n=1 Tax=Paenibacillus sp. TaxID=58172 RepID=UPI002D2CD667|nr:cupin domain-containing protein [Paenibacillus sp.]HZG88114.1 cupin domain-containing protein [Paenibacillus sp.]
MSKRLNYVTPADVETQVFPWGKIQWLSEPNVTGSQVMTTGVVALETGKGHDRHNHPGCDEIIYVMEGTGEQFIELADGTTDRREVKAGDLIFIPADLFHGTLNTGASEMRLLVVYQTAGPEAFLRTLPDCTIIPAANAP